MTIAPIRRSVHVKVQPSRAFDIFTAQIGRWWPQGNGIGPRQLVELVIEPGAGGRWFERDARGDETQWGQVLVWAPPERLVLAWQLNRQKRFDPGLVTEVELTFTAASDGGSDVSLEHRDLERFGQDGAHWAASIGGGWSQRLGEFKAYVDLNEFPEQEE